MSEPKTDEEKDLEQNLEYAEQHVKRLKKVLKTRSKSQLILMTIGLLSDLSEMKEISKILLEQNKALRGESK
jgi:uncharacterized protein YciI